MRGGVSKLVHFEFESLHRCWRSLLSALRRYSGQLVGICFLFLLLQVVACLLRMKWLGHCGSSLYSNLMLTFQFCSAQSLCKHVIDFDSTSLPRGRTWERFRRSQTPGICWRLRSWLGCLGGKSHRLEKPCSWRVNLMLSLHSGNLDPASCTPSHVSEPCGLQIEVS